MVRARVRQIRQRAAASAPVATVPALTQRAGWFIAVEGGDGTGKSTQIAALAAWLAGRGFEVVATREPGGTDLGRQLREMLLHRDDLGGVGERTEALLFAADRAHHIEKVVRPALARGAIVLTDRHVDSSIAYQSGGRGLPADIITGLSAFATDGVRPDLTILLDLDPDLARERAEGRTGKGGAQGQGPDRLEAEPAEFHARVRAVFVARAAADPKRYLVIDAAEPASVITGICKDKLAVLLPPSPREAAEEADRQRALAAAEEAELAEHLARAAAARAEAEQAARAAEERERAAAEAEETARKARLEGAAERAAAEKAEAEQALEEARRRAEAERAAQEALAAERAAKDAARREEAEQVVRQAEARAKAQAREQAAADLAARAESEARTRQLVVRASAAAGLATGSAAGSAPGSAPGSAAGSAAGLKGPHPHDDSPDSSSHEDEHDPDNDGRPTSHKKSRKHHRSLADDLLGEGLDEPSTKTRRWRSRDDS